MAEEILNNDIVRDNSNVDSPSSIDTFFGRREDNIELHIYDLNNNLLYSENKFTEYTSDSVNPSNLISSIDVDPKNILNNRGYSTGKYKLKFNILRNKVLNSNKAEFFINEISPSRTELKITTPNVSNNILDPAVAIFISEIETNYFDSFGLNFGDDIILKGVNIVLDKTPDKHEIFIKLSAPLPNIPQKYFKIVESLSDSFETIEDLGNPEPTIVSTPLRGPNFNIDVKVDNSIPTNYKTYNDILNYSLTSSYQRLLNNLENEDNINIQYDYIRPVSASTENTDIPYHFENFVHFGSAVERLKNFEYKLELIELYASQSSNIDNITGNTSSSFYILNNKENINSKKEEVIKHFDGYERFLYYGSGTYSWPKANTTPPFNLHSVTSSQAKTWLGSEKDTSIFYGGQLLSASSFDKQNEYSLIRNIPNHIVDNSDNNFYLSFTNMIGQHFDHIWTYIKNITELNNTHHTRGISKDLVYYQLKSLGIETFDQFENTDLIEYILGEGSSGSNSYDAPSNQTMITASNDGSIAKRDITKEIWKRLYHNAPYLLKTKGTERGLRALMSCYGVPSTILNVKEYGGPVKDKTGYKTFSYEKSGLALHGNTRLEHGKYFIETNWSSSLTDALSASAKTVEFRIKPFRNGNSPHFYQLWALAGNNDATSDDVLKEPHLRLFPYTGSADISSSGDAFQYGKISLIVSGVISASTSHFPVYNGDFWNVFIGTEGTSGSDDNKGGSKASFLEDCHQIIFLLIMLVFLVQCKKLDTILENYYPMIHL